VQYLIDLAQREDVRRVVDAVTETPQVQGVVLEPDPYWLRSWNALAVLGRRRYESWLDVWHHYARRGIPVPFWMHQNVYGPTGYNIPLRPLGLSDLKKWRPPDWDFYLQVTGAEKSELPLVLKVCLLPSTEPDTPEIPRFENVGFRVVYEVRPRAFLYSNPRKIRRPLIGGVSLGSGTIAYGTLGGILEDTANRRYAMTCSHVVSSGQTVDQPAQYDDSKTAGNIGIRAQGTSLSASASGSLCNPATAANEVDAALIDLGNGVSSDFEVLDIGKLSGVAKIAAMSVGQTVETTGRTSGHRLLEIGGMAVTYQFQASPAGPKYCFKNLFEVRWPYSNRKPPVQPGDSGSWVCMPDSTGLAWCGMIIGGDRMIGYAAFTEKIENWWSGPPLSLKLHVA
jgi:hypothetical protein